MFRIPSAKRALLFTLVLLTITDLSVFLDIPIFRQSLGFILLTFVPGFLILHILKLDQLKLTEKIVLSIGLSISFLMFFGLLINFIYPLLSYNTPLSINSVVMSFSIVTLTLAIIAHLRNGDTPFADLSVLRLNTKEKAFLVLPAFFPLLSILGTHFLNTTNNNIMLLVLLFLIPAYITYISTQNKQVPEKIYPAAIFFTAISLLFMYNLRSNYLIGSDIHEEYYLFQQTLQNGYWETFANNPLDACLSISILPTIYQLFVNINPQYLYKVLYPFLFSFSPLVVFIISRKYLGSFYGFLASSVFMLDQANFFSWGCVRTYVAIFFFILAIMVLFNDSLRELDKKLLFIIFAISCIVSHYSSAYIFLFLLLFTWIGAQIIAKPKFTALSLGPTERTNSVNLIRTEETPAPISSKLWLKKKITFHHVTEVD
ncbi:MAG TPA: hypothetical protein ENF45_06055 [Bacteroidetes bacterium]|nr:hypothetical protein [Bacteroidota bacterium]